MSVTVSSLALKWSKRPKWLNVETLERDFSNQTVPIRGQAKKVGVFEKMLERVSSLVTRRGDSDRGAYVPLTNVEPPV